MHTFSKLTILLIAALLCYGAPFQSRAEAKDSQPIPALRVAPHNFFYGSLTPVGEVNAEEKALLQTLLNEIERTPEDFEPIYHFMRQHPDSCWSISLSYRLGVALRGRGYISRAIECWQTTWDKRLQANGATARQQVDEAAAELAELYARLGRMSDLSVLLQEIEGRSFNGFSRVKLVSAREGLNKMKNDPGKAFLCGPMALKNICQEMRPNLVTGAFESARSTTNGFSLAELEQLARKEGLQPRLAFRSPGAAIIAPAVVHWKAGHYAALLGQDPTGWRVVDPTFGNATKIQTDTLEQEASGYFLVFEQDLPTGWRLVTPDEASSVFGKGYCATVDDEETRPTDQKVCSGKQGEPGMPVYAFHAASTSLNIQDVPLVFNPARGPSMTVILTYNSLDNGYRPNPGNYVSWLGPQWTCNLFASVWEVSATKVEYYTEGGGYETYTEGATTGIYYSGVKTVARIERVGSSAPYTYRRVMPDGSEETFAMRQGNKLYRTQKKDPQGFKLTYTYSTTTDNNQSYAKLQTVANDFGDTLTLNHHGDGDKSHVSSIYLNTIYGGSRNVQLSYDTHEAAGLLTGILDSISIASSFQYVPGTPVINKMTTPYGPTTFDQGQGTKGGWATIPPAPPASYPATDYRWIEATDPMGNKERLEYVGDVRRVSSTYATFLSNEACHSGITPSTQFDTTWQEANSQLLFYRNSFYWDKRAMAKTGAPKYEDAKIYHWLHKGAQASGVLESEKRPGEMRIWYTYANQTITWDLPASGVALPVKISRKSPTAQEMVQFTYNKYGLVKSAIDQKGRETKKTYYKLVATDPDDEGILVKDVQIKIDSSGTFRNLASYVYDTSGATRLKNMPTEVTDAAGKVTLFRYYPPGSPANKEGLLKEIENAKNEIMLYDYDNLGRGFLSSVRSPGVPAPGGATLYHQTVFWPDEYDRIATVTDLSDNVTTSYVSDNLDRIVSVTYPDNTTEQFKYENLSMVLHKDRAGLNTAFEYDGNGKTVTMTEPSGVRTFYSWCGCGSLNSITDTKGTTQWMLHPTTGRLQFKIMPDGSSIEYIYNDFGYLTDTIDPKGQREHLAYNVDGSVQQISYLKNSDLSVLPTPGVSFVYDDYLPRLKQMIDGIGTTTFNYYPLSATPAAGAGQLSSVDGPLPNDTIFIDYDNLGRAYRRRLTSTGTTITDTIDAMGRITSTSNPLGTFSYGYVNTASGATYRVDTATLPNGMSTKMNYYGPSQDFRAQDIVHRFSNLSTLAQYSYDYNQAGNIRTWALTQNGASRHHVFEYDKEQQLTRSYVYSGLPSAPGPFTDGFAYAYDGNGNRTDQQEEHNGSRYSAVFGYNALNQMTNRAAPGRTRFKGSLVSNTDNNPDPGKVTVIDGAGRIPANMTSANEFNIFATNSQVTLEAKDLANRTTTKNYNVTTLALGDASHQYAYDLAGNVSKRTTAAPSGEIAYEWDARNRLTAVVTGTARSEFYYDGMGRLARVIEKTDGQIASDLSYIWLEDELLEERHTSSGAVTTKFFNEGMLTSEKLFFLKDHLGSVRTVVDSSSNVRAEYDYDPYGQQTKIRGNVDVTIGYAGYFYHAPTKLCLAVLRAYDPTSGRWLSRDPLGEAAGLNLYSYVLNDPINGFDPLGLDRLQTAANFAAGMADNLSFGLTRKIREMNPDFFEVDKCSKAYRNGDRAGTLLSLSMGLGRAAYMGATKAASVMINAAGATRANAVLAWKTRNTLKQLFNYGLTPKTPLKYMYDRYKSDWAKWIAASGRTATGADNMLFGIPGSWNILGAGYFLGNGLANKINPLDSHDCGCDE